MRGNCDDYSLKVKIRGFAKNSKNWGAQFWILLLASVIPCG